MHHTHFPGRITLSNEALAQALTEVDGSLHHDGFEHFLLVNANGGNIPALNIATVRISGQ